MPLAFAVAARSDVAIDANAYTITMTRNFDAPKTQVFEAWTQSRHVACWWDPEGKPLAECEIDLRVGGRFRFVTQGVPDMPFTGTYLEISPPELLAFDANGATGTVVLEETGGRTQMTVTIDCGSAQMLESYLKMRVEVGTAQTLDNLVAYVKGL